MPAWWITFRDPKDSCCVEAKTPDDARGIASKYRFGYINDCRQLPYPASPRVGPQTSTPSFCLHPDRCAGHSSCPRRYSCVE